MERFHVCSGACFQDLAGELCRNLHQAQYSIRAAVCWFSHREIFEVLLNRLRNGVHMFENTQFPLAGSEHWYGGVERENKYPENGLYA